MSQIQNLRTYILKECEEGGSASLADIMARFDFHQHSIPTLNEIRQALKGMEAISVLRKNGEIFVNIGNSESIVDTNEISENDMESAYNTYIKGIKGFAK